MDVPKTFLELPTEVRLLIYVPYFRNLVLSYPFLCCPPLLLTSKQICNEARPFFYNHATFDLRSTEHLVDYLSSLPSSTLRELRHLRFYPAQLELMESMFDLFCPTISEILALCDGLQLDSLEFKLYSEGYTNPLLWYNLKVEAKKIHHFLSSETGFERLFVSIGQSEEYQLMLEQQLGIWSPDLASYGQSDFRQSQPVLGDRVRHDATFKVIKCMTDKVDECMQGEWHDQTGSADEEAWKAQQGQIWYALRITRNATPDTVDTDAEKERAWTLQDLRHGMDKSLLKIMDPCGPGLGILRIGRGRFGRLIGIM